MPLVPEAEKVESHVSQRQIELFLQRRESTAMVAPDLAEEPDDTLCWLLPSPAARCYWCMLGKTWQSASSNEREDNSETWGLKSWES